MVFTRNKRKANNGNKQRPIKIVHLSTDSSLQKNDSTVTLDICPKEAGHPDRIREFNWFAENFARDVLRRKDLPNMLDLLPSFEDDEFAFSQEMLATEVQREINPLLITLVLDLRPKLSKIANSFSEQVAQHDDFPDKVRNLLDGMRNHKIALSRCLSVRDACKEIRGLSQTVDTFLQWKNGQSFVNNPLSMWRHLRTLESLGLGAVIIFLLLKYVQTLIMNYVRVSPDAILSMVDHPTNARKRVTQSVVSVKWFLKGLRGLPGLSDATQGLLQLTTIVQSRGFMRLMNGTSNTVEWHPALLRTRNVLENREAARVRLLNNASSALWECVLQRWGVAGQIASYMPSWMGNWWIQGLLRLLVTAAIAYGIKPLSNAMLTMFSPAVNRVLLWCHMLAFRSQKNRNLMNKNLQVGREAFEQIAEKHANRMESNMAKKRANRTKRLIK